MNDEKGLGWICLARSFMFHWMYPKGRKFTMAEAWVDLIMLCNFSDSKTLIEKNLVTVKRGQHFTSVQKLSTRWLWSRHEIRSFLKLLEKDNMIVSESSNKFTILTICNYDNYQLKQPTKRKQKTNEAETEQKQSDTTNNDNNNNKLSNNIYNLDFVSVEFLVVFKTWLDYKRNRRQSYKSKESLEACYKKLLRISDNDPEKAKEIIENAMAGNYAGFFQLDQKTKPVVQVPTKAAPFKNDYQE